MNIKSILMVIFVIFLLYLVIRYIVKDAKILTGLMAGTTMQTVQANSLAKNSSELNSSNFAYSIWFYVDDWNYKYGDKKIIFGRTTSKSSESSGDADIETLGPCPAVILGAVENDITILLGVGGEKEGFGQRGGVGEDTSDQTGQEGCKVSQYGCCPDGVNYATFSGDTCSNKTGQEGCKVSQYGCCPDGVNYAKYENDTCNKKIPSGSGPSQYSNLSRCTVKNVPIQKWVNLLISVYGRSLDVYIDGKLVKTCLLPGIAKINNEANVYITPLGGFSGWTSKFTYYPTALNPQEAWNIYQDGYGASWLANIFGKYNVKVSVLENGTEDSSFTF